MPFVNFNHNRIEAKIQLNHSVTQLSINQSSIFNQSLFISHYVRHLHKCTEDGEQSS